jgi:hypothetical protein
MSFLKRKNTTGNEISSKQLCVKLQTLYAYLVFFNKKLLSFKEQDDSGQWNGKDAKVTMTFFKILSWRMPKQTKENHIKISFKLRHKNKKRYPNHHKVIFGIISPLLMI